MSVIRVGIVVFDQIIPFHLSVPCAVFEKALSAMARRSTSCRSVRQNPAS